MQKIISDADYLPVIRLKEECTVSRHRSIMSEELKNEIAKELGVYNTVASEGWGAVSARDCGNIVKKAIEMAERNMEFR
jgi:small acid-soluble spore protein F (minor alpha/beta-type SASP)